MTVMAPHLQTIGHGGHSLLPESMTHGTHGRQACARGGYSYIACRSGRPITWQYKTYGAPVILAKVRTQYMRAMLPP
jgi:hypothetical protein